MLNQVAAEALYSATYVENYLDSVENLPDDIQRYLSRIREIDVQYRGHIRDVDYHYEQWSKNAPANNAAAVAAANTIFSQHTLATDGGCVEPAAALTPAAAKRSRAIGRIQQSLIAAQELGDEKLQIVNQLQELIDHKNRQLEGDFKNLDYGNSAPHTPTSGGALGLGEGIALSISGGIDGASKSHHTNHTNNSHGGSSYGNSPAATAAHASPAHTHTTYGTNNNNNNINATGHIGNHASTSAVTDRYHHHLQQQQQQQQQHQQQAHHQQQHPQHHQHQHNSTGIAPGNHATASADRGGQTKRPRRARNDAGSSGGGGNSGETGSGDNADTPLKLGSAAAAAAAGSTVGSATMTTPLSTAASAANTSGGNGGGIGANANHVKKASGIISGSVGGPGGGGGGNGGSAGGSHSASGASGASANSAASGSSNRKKTKRKSGRASQSTGGGNQQQGGGLGAGGGLGGSGAGGSGGGGGGHPSRDRDGNTPPEDHIDPDEPTYCLCDQISFGEMILCDNDLCPIEWFHFSCVTLTTKPKGKWYCPNCRGDRSNVMKPKAQFLKELERYNKEKEEKT